MTKQSFTKTALLALASLAIVATTAKSQVTYSSAGDFLLGFRQTGTANDILVDIGSFNLNSSTSISLGDLGTKLAATFGAGWATDASVFFSIAGTGVSGDPSNTSYVTKVQYNGDPAPTPWNSLSSGNAISLKNKIIAEGTAYNTFSQTPGNPAVVQPTSSTNSYASYMPGGVNDAGHAQGNISYGFFNPTTEGTFSQGTGNVQLDVYRILSGSTAAATEVGYFTLSSDGSTLTYTPLAVPEPSTFALIGVAGIAGVFIRRRQFKSLI